VLGPECGNKKAGARTGFLCPSDRLTSWLRPWPRQQVRQAPERQPVRAQARERQQVPRAPAQALVRQPVLSRAPVEEFAGRSPPRPARRSQRSELSVS